MSAPSIQVRNVSFAYDNGKTVLEDVSIKIDPRDFACFIGPNGGGKTTLLRLILGQMTPSSGDILIGGDPVALRQRRIGYVPQYFRFDAQFPVKVMDVVLMARLGRGILGRYNRADRAAAAKALRDVSLYDLHGEPLSELSGGQLQRVLIARALAGEPELLLLDEPTASVDPAFQKELYDLLYELNDRMTIVMATHDTGFVGSLVDRVVCINRTVQLHPTSEITGERIFELYGGGVAMVRHDHRCAEGGHEWPNS